MALLKLTVRVYHKFSLFANFSSGEKNRGQTGETLMGHPTKRMLRNKETVTAHGALETYGKNIPQVFAFCKFQFLGEKQEPNWGT